MYMLTPLTLYIIRHPSIGFLNTVLPVEVWITHGAALSCYYWKGQRASLSYRCQKFKRNWGWKWCRRCLWFCGIERAGTFVAPQRGKATTGSLGKEMPFRSSSFSFHLLLLRQFMIHSSIDSLEEAMTAHHQGSRRCGGDASKWIGLLCPMEESFVFCNGLWLDASIYIYPITKK